MYEKILNNIENSENDLEIPSINDLIGIHPNADSDTIQSNDSAYTQIEPVYFPKEHNEEQLEIVEKPKGTIRFLFKAHQEQENPTLLLI